MAIGGLTVGELQDRMTAKEAKSWKRFRLINGPFGQERADYHAAQICQAVFLALEAFSENVPEEQRATLEKCLLKFKTVFQKSPEESEQENGNRLANELQAFIGRFR